MRLSKEIQKSPQLLFDFVAEKLWKQQYKSVDVGTSWCLYRSTVYGKPVSCAAGHVMPDEVYNKSFEDMKIQDVIESCVSGSETEKAWAEEFSTECINLLEMLQNLHDRVIEVDVDGKFKPDSFYTNFLTLATRSWLNLDTTFLKKLCGKDTENHAQNN